MISLQQAKFFLKNKKNRNILIMIILFIIWGIVLAHNISSPPPKESERVLICDKCGYTAVMKFTDLNSLRCPKCGEGKMHYVMKCSVCQYEFPYKRPFISPGLTKKEQRKQMADYLKCPNCKSHEVFPVSVKLWKMKQNAQ